MSSPILVTKLFIPATRPKLVPRPRLVERLTSGLHRKLTLISAPAGFGKTTLVTEWLDNLRGDTQQEDSIKNRITWFSLDEGDNDPVRFLTYFTAALDQIDEIDAREVMDMLQSPQPPSIEAILTSLINQIAVISDRILLVLDDFHLIEDPSVYEALSFTLENLPSQMHLVITTREDPLLPLSRLRVRGQLLELRAADLRFTSAEAAEFLNQVMGLNLSTKDIITLETRTEGWIAGLQLAAISMQTLDDTTTFIQSFTGSNRLVLDYLIEEVLNQLPEKTQNFLLKTAIIKRLNGSLCDAVSGQENSQTTLELLDRANLFIVPLDEERRWYRYHHLFAELLLQRLNATHSDLINELHSKAVIWYEMNGYLSEAIQHAFAGNDTKTAIRLIEKGSLDALERSDFSFILNAVDLLPDNALESSPWLFVYHTWALILMGRVDIVGPKLENTDWLLDSVSDDEAKRQEMVGYIAGLKEHLAGWQRDYTNIIDYFNQVRENLPENHWICGYCAMGMGTVFWGSGDLAEAKEVFTEASSIGKASGNKRVAVASALYLGHSLELEGHLQQAVTHFQDSFQLTKQDGRELPIACYLHVDISRLLYELDELKLASQHLKVGIEQCQQLSDGRVEKLGHCLMARVYLAQGDFENALTSIQTAEQTHPGTEATVDMRGAEYPHIRLWLQQKKLREVEAWLNEGSINLKNISHFKTKLTYTMHARALIALGRAYPDGPHLNNALKLLAELLELAEGNGWGNKVIEILTLYSLAHDADGDTVKAISILERALNPAEPEKYIRTFVDEGQPMARLLYKSLSQGIAPDYVQQLLAAFPIDEPEKNKPPKSQVSEAEWVEPLSERELEVLKLIAEGLTNQEISARLYLSLNTVKAHTRNIYSKLGVNSRTQATARARSLGLLIST